MTERRLTSRQDRMYARDERDSQWEFMERVAREGVVWICPWDKYHRHGRRCVNKWCTSGTFLPVEGGKWQCVYCRVLMPSVPDDKVYVFGLLGSDQLFSWLAAHKDWWKHGRWSEKRCARSIRITAAGRKALKHREKYDMEPIHGGMVEPGYIVTPWPRKKASR